MDNQKITNIDILLQKNIITPTEMDALEHGTYEDIHHALFRIQQEHTDIELNIDNLTKEFQERYPGETFLSEDSQDDKEEKKELKPLLQHNSHETHGEETSLEERMATNFDIEKQNQLDERIESILKTSDVSEKQQKVRDLFNSLDKETLYEERANDIKRHIEQVSPQNAAAIIQQIDERHAQLAQRRFTSPEQQASYKKYLDRIIETVPGMNGKQLRTFLLRYVNRQLQGTHTDFTKLFLDETTKTYIVPEEVQKAIITNQEVNVSQLQDTWDEEKEDRSSFADWIKQRVYKRVQKELSKKESPEEGFEEPDNSFEEPDIGEESLQGELPEAAESMVGEEAAGLGAEGTGLAEEAGGLGSEALAAAPAGEAAALAPVAAAPAAAPAVATAGAVGAGFPVWGTILIILGAILLFVLLVVFILNFFSVPNQGTTTGSCQAQDPASISEMENALKQQFNISISGSGDTVIKDVYHTICKLSGYKILSLAGIPQFQVSITLHQASEGPCHEHVEASNPQNRIIDIYPCANSSGNEFLLTHEIGHLVSYNSPQLFDKFCTDVYHGTIDKTRSVDSGRCSSSTPYTIPTYNCLFDYGVGPYPQECFPDMIGSFFTYKDFQDVYNGKPVDNDKMSNYPANFPSYYFFATNNIFQATSSDQGSYSGTCNEGTSPCTTSELASTFGNQATYASVICQAESSSNVDQLHNSCGQSVTNGCQEYSVGLFQINLNAHAAEFAPNCAKYIKTVSYKGSSTCGCQVNSKAMWACLQQNNYLDISHQENYALSLLKGNNNHWQPIWSTAAVCQVP